MAHRITEALEFMQACGVTDLTTPEINRTTLYTSHEALLLGFEQAMTRIDSTSGRWYDTSRPFPVDRRPHPPARRCPCRVLPRHRQPDRRQGRPDHAGRGPPAPVRRAQPRQRARPAHRDQPHGPRQGRAPPAGPGPRPAARGPGRGLVVRPDARQHRQVLAPATRPAPSTASWPRSAASSPSTRPRAPTPAASMSR